MKKTAAVALCAFAVLLAASFAAALSVKTALQALTAPHDEACSNVAIFSERHMKTFAARYRLVYRVYGRGMGRCDAAAPDARYEFVGHYRPRENRAAYIDGVMAALRSDGWQRVPPDDATPPSATFRSEGLALTLTLTSAGSSLSRLPAPPMKPEVVDVLIVPNGPLPHADASPEPEASGDVARGALSQMTTFYPKPLPDGMTLDDSLSQAVEDIMVSGFTVEDGRGRSSLVDERPLPPKAAACDLFGVWYRRPPRGTQPKCMRWATSSTGIPVYVEDDARAGADPLYAFADADTAIVILRGSRKLLPLTRAEVLRLIDRMQPTNGERLRL